MKNYVVIGGSTGIGRALVEQLSTDHQVWATYNQTPIESKDRVTYHQLDVTAENMDLTWLPDQIDGLAYCVGSIALKPFHRIKAEEFMQDYQKQTVAAIQILQQSLSALKASDQASVVLFSTVAVQTGFPFHALVSSSKGAIEGLTKALSAEWAPKIRVNAIAPSITDTPLASNLLSTQEKKDANAQRHPLKAVGEAEDIAKLAAFLLKEDSRWITGQVHHIDGGISSLKV
ncbi:MAG: SDR family oxidoreductase [Bacteroidia bacterium]|jgi:NAD(P)-dependent dehydrogenase (short-subunit alcohol dehydrogenase family)|nr:SDR family oxidoreductase [Bacteroidia bacterium]